MHQHAVSIKWDDPSLAITWPIITNTTPSLSAKDEDGLLFKDAPAF